MNENPLAVKLPGLELKNLSCRQAAVSVLAKNTENTMI